jgi:hypothetical protein
VKAKGLRRGVFGRIAITRCLCKRIWAQRRSTSSA